MTTIHLRGVAERAESPRQPLGPNVVAPETLPLLVEFTYASGPVGIAMLRREANGDIWAEAEAIDGDWRQDCPYFAVGVSGPLISKASETVAGAVTAGKVCSLSVTRKNIDPGLPPYEVVDA